MFLNPAFSKFSACFFFTISLTSNLLYDFPTSNSYDWAISLTSSSLQICGLPTPLHSLKTFFSFCKSFQQMIYSSPGTWSIVPLLLIVNCIYFLDRRLSSVCTSNMIFTISILVYPLPLAGLGSLTLFVFSDGVMEAGMLHWCLMGGIWLPCFSYTYCTIYSSPGVSVELLDNRISLFLFHSLQWLTYLMPGAGDKSLPLSWYCQSNQR